MLLALNCSLITGEQQHVQAESQITVISIYSALLLTLLTRANRALIKSSSLCRESGAHWDAQCTHSRVDMHSITRTATTVNRPSAFKGTACVSLMTMASVQLCRQSNGLSFIYACQDT